MVTRREGHDHNFFYNVGEERGSVQNLAQLVTNQYPIMNKEINIFTFKLAHQSIHNTTQLESSTH